MSFQFSSQIQLHHTDAAGILFYSRIFELAFDAFDAFLAAGGLSIAKIIRKSDYLMPYVHAEADFMAPLTVGDVVVIEVTVERIGETSFTLSYIFRQGAVTAARVKTVHVTVSKESNKKTPLPKEIKRVLELHLGVATD